MGDIRKTPQAKADMKAPPAPSGPPRLTTPAQTVGMYGPVTNTGMVALFGSAIKAEKSPKPVWGDWVRGLFWLWNKRGYGFKSSSRLLFFTVCFYFFWQTSVSETPDAAFSATTAPDLRGFSAGPVTVALSQEDCQDFINRLRDALTASAVWGVCMFFHFPHYPLPKSCEYDFISSEF
jgi:hypothetical protein